MFKPFALRLELLESMASQSGPVEVNGKFSTNFHEVRAASSEGTDEDELCKNLSLIGISHWAFLGHVQSAPF